MLTPFHLAIHVTDLEDARGFYGGVLGCTEGRSTETWVDFDFFGHQLSLHLGTPFATTDTGKVGEAVKRIKGHTDLPVCVGFGVKTPADAIAIARGADGVVVGSALVERVRLSLDADGKATEKTVSAVTSLVAKLAAGVRSVAKAAA